MTKRLVKVAKLIEGDTGFVIELVTVLFEFGGKGDTVTALAFVPLDDVDCDIVLDKVVNGVLVEDVMLVTVSDGVFAEDVVDVLRR